MADMPFIDLAEQYRRLQGEMDAAILSAVASTRFINGPQVAEFEAALAEEVGAAACVACANGTDALSLVLLAWGVGPGDAVLCPALTFFATAEVVSLLGAVPIFVDIDPVTFNIDPVDLEAKILAVAAEGRLRPRAIIPVDLYGLPYDYEPVAAIADRHKLPILEDAAQGLGGVYGGRRACRLGTAGATSFFPSKPLGCYGDGGAVLTDDLSLAETVRSLRTHGTAGERYRHVRVGVNSRLDTIQAAILLVKLKVFEDELALRRKVADAYERELAWSLQDMGRVPVTPGGRLSAWAQYTVRVPAALRAGVVASLSARGVPSMIHYPSPLHLQPAFASLGGAEGDHPAAERAAREVLSLPMHPYLSVEDVKKVSTALLEAIEESARAAGMELAGLLGGDRPRGGER